MIPSSRLVPTSLNKGRPVVLDEPGSEVAQSITELAVRLSGAETPQANGEAFAMAADTKKRRFGRRKT